MKGFGRTMYIRESRKCVETSCNNVSVNVMISTRTPLKEIFCDVETMIEMRNDLSDTLIDTYRM